VLYLIKRGPRPDHHKAPYHPVIICDRKAEARDEAGCTCRKATIWVSNPREGLSGWLLVRWQGLDLDLGPVVHACELPDGTRSGFAHNRKAEPWTLLSGAVWWSPAQMPGWLAELGVVYPPDRFTQQGILDDRANDGASGFGNRVPPTHWPVASDEAHR
jgi:hypothetical protein